METSKFDSCKSKLTWQMIKIMDYLKTENIKVKLKDKIKYELKCKNNGILKIRASEVTLRAITTDAEGELDQVLQALFILQMDAAMDMMTMIDKVKK